MDWYVLQAFSGYENKVNLLLKIELNVVACKIHLKKFWYQQKKFLKSKKEKEEVREKIFSWICHD